jgi:hypothetical protein
MDMDDPWGSPWAEEEEVPIHPRLVSKKSDSEVKPTTPVQPSTLALDEKTNSPWDDADNSGFADWAAIPEDIGNTRRLDSTDKEWEGNSEPDIQLKASLPAELPWNNAAERPVKVFPKLSPSSEPNFAELSRQSSPDPWAVQFNREDEPTSTNYRDGEGVKVDSSEVLTGEEKFAEEVVCPLGDEILSGGSTTPLGKVVSQDGSILQPAADILEASLAGVKEEISTQTPDTEVVSSRPSSSPSEHSHHEEHFHESPRTSIDEEPKRSQIPRKVSSKIQELVEHFDGLAKPVQSLELVRAVSQGILEVPDSPVPNEDSQEQSYSVASGDESQTDGDMDDFGDFEDGNSDIEESSSKGFFPAQGSSDLSPEAEFGKERDVPPRKNPGPVIFNIVPSDLARVYPEDGFIPSTENVFVPDRDLDNTLATTEQRKTWYRISRYGTKRKHDNGDDENYARVTWPQSHVRQDTLKIVSRWMEEDRISGHVVLGGVGKGSSVFGWSDAKAAPIPIAQAFASKQGKKPEPSTTTPVPEVPREWPKGLVRSRSTSKTRSPSKARRRSSLKSISISEEVPAPKVPIPNFGWSATPGPASNQARVATTSAYSPAVDSKSPPRKSRSSHRSTTSVSSSVTAVPKDVSSALTSRKPSISRASVPKPPILDVAKLQDEDDDEWGEMVASPVIAVAPILPILPKVTIHKKSQSFGKLPTIDDMPRSTISPLAVQQPDHRRPPSFDEILALKPSTTIPSLSSKTSNGMNSNLMQASVPDPVLPTVTPINANTLSNGDPWASADFSFFEASVSPVKLTPNVIQKPAVSKTVKFSTPAPVPTEASRNKWKSKEEIEQDMIVERVVKGLPDLSYMLKR